MRKLTCEETNELAADLAITAGEWCRDNNTAGGAVVAVETKICETGVKIQMKITLIQQERSPANE